MFSTLHVVFYLVLTTIQLARYYYPDKIKPILGAKSCVHDLPFQRRKNWSSKSMSFSSWSMAS